MLCTGLNALILSVSKCYFYQLMSHKELIKCVKESKQVQEFLHCTQICCKEPAVLTLAPKYNAKKAPMIKKTCLSILSSLGSQLGHHILFWGWLDVFSLCFIHISVEPHQSSFGSRPRTTFSGGLGLLVWCASRSGWQRSLLYKWPH